MPFIFVSPLRDFDFDFVGRFIAGLGVCAFHLRRFEVIRNKLRLRSALHALLQSEGKVDQQDKICWRSDELSQLSEVTLPALLYETFGV